MRAARSFCERLAQVSATPGTASGTAAWSHNSHQAPEHSQHQTDDGAGSVITQELTDRIQQAEQLLLARLESMSASAVMRNSRGQHAGHHRDAALLDETGPLLAAFEHLQSRVEVRNDAAGCCEGRGQDIARF